MKQEIWVKNLIKQAQNTQIRINYYFCQSLNIINQTT
jgi:hypothetical protein